MLVSIHFKGKGGSVWILQLIALFINCLRPRISFFISEMTLALETENGGGVRITITKSACVWYTLPQWKWGPRNESDRTLSVLLLVI
jgi:MFS-type transporter involved in bile tolerance (Atg22 family)